MKFLLLLPAILYTVIILTNPWLASMEEEVSLFWMLKQKIPVISYITVFFVLYMILVWIVLTSSGIIVSYKNKKQDKEIWELKSKLLDWQEWLIDWIDGKFEKILKSSIEEGNKKTEAYKKENEKIVSNLEFKLESFEKKLENFDKKIDKLKK